MVHQDNNFTENREVSVGISVRDIFNTCLHYWYLCILSVVVCTGLFFFIAQSISLEYVVYGFAVLKSDEKKGKISENILFSLLDIGNYGQDVENERYIVQSSFVMEQVVKRLGIDVIYKYKPFLRYENLYKQSPVKLTYLSKIPKKGISMEITIISQSEYKYRFPNAESNDWERATFGKEIVTNNGAFIINKTPKFSDNFIDEIIYLNIINPFDRAKLVCENFEAKKADKETTVISFTSKGDNNEMIKDIMNTAVSVYNDGLINDKNDIALNTQAFIAERIAALNKDLKEIDGGIAQLKKHHNITDIDIATEKYVESGEKYYDNVAEIEMQLSLVTFIRDYLANSGNKHELIPTNIGVANFGLQEQILKYNEENLKIGKLATASGEHNPYYLELKKGLDVMRANIIRSINNQYLSLKTALVKARSQESVSLRRIASIPTQEKEINEIVRQQKIKETLYLYLLDKREENALQFAITEPNAIMLVSATGTNLPISPNMVTYVILGLIIGLGLPVVIIYFNQWLHSLDRTVHNRQDVEQLTNIPVIGELPRKKKCQEGQEVIVTSTGKDRISESFRIIRGNLDFMLRKKNGKASIIQLTSSIPGEGKSYIAINLALTFAHMGEKVLAIDMDLRKGKFSKNIGEKSNIGLSAYLTGRVNEIDTIINKGVYYPNFDVISLGAIPPNPVSLLTNARFDEMMIELTKRYDYIFLDTVPYLIVADAILINRFADVTLYVIRNNMVDKRYVPVIEQLNNENKIKNVTILVADVDTDSKQYGYKGHGYSYVGGEDK
ncbi:MAG: polysaccharide biosynthesis tyrosine autokinase [Muribaculaceae bacterium]